DLPERERLAPKPAKIVGYSGANMNRLTNDWVAAILSADRETRSSLVKLRARSRQLFRDNGHAAGFARAMEDNIIGTSGIGVNPRMRAPRGKLLKGYNLGAWEAFQRWGERDTCTVDGQNGWIETQRLALRTWLIDGETFLRRVPGFDNGFGYALQFIDADLLDESYNIPRTDRSNEITQGIEMDGWGRPVAYHFWTAYASDLSKRRERMRIPADEIIHLFVQWRANQRRGVPIMAPVMIALKMLDGYTEAEITQARIAASNGGFFVMRGEQAASMGVTQDPNADGSEYIEMEAEAGLARQLPPGWEFQEWDPAHPNGNFANFQMAMLRVIAQGLGVSAITLSGNLSDTSYSSGRVGLQAERDRFKAVQGWFGDRIVLPVYRDVIRYGSMAGEIDLPTPEPSKWCACQLEPRGWPWIDPKSDAMATEMRLKNRLTSPQRVCAAEGTDFEEVLDEWQEAADMMAERDLDMPTFGEQPMSDSTTEATPPTTGDGTAKGNGPGLVLYGPKEAVQ
ncbi:MAG: phage portal protein, partial [Mycobacterium sp.]